MANLLESETTIAIILGASDWTRAGLGKARSFHKSAAYLLQYLLCNRPSGLALNPDLVLSLFDDSAAASTQLVRIKEFVREIVLDRRESQQPITDILIYYIGHGTCDDGGVLHLLVRNTDNGIEAQSSISTPDLAKVLKVAAPQQRRICIFDCCFSEAAVDSLAAMGPLDEAVTKVGALNMVADSPSPQRGTMLLCSCPRGSSSIGVPNAERTLFTGALLQVLQQGSSTPHAMLSFSELKEDIYEVMLRQHSGPMVPRPALHQPNQQDGDLTRLPAFPNVREVKFRAERLEKEREVAEAKRQEEELLAAEAKRQEEERLAVEAKRREDERLAAEAKRQEDERLAAEAKRQEDERLAAEAKRQEDERLAAEAKRREDERLAAEAKRQEDERLAAEAKRQEDERLAAEAKRQEDERLAAEAKRQEDERLAAEAKRQEEERLAAEARRQEDERLAAEAKRQEEERLTAEARRQEDERLAAEARRQEDERLAAEAKRQEDEQLVSDGGQIIGKVPGGDTSRDHRFLIFSIFVFGVIAVVALIFVKFFYVVRYPVANEQVEGGSAYLSPFVGVTDEPPEPTHSQIEKLEGLAREGCVFFTVSDRGGVRQRFVNKSIDSIQMSNIERASKAANAVIGFSPGWGRAPMESAQSFARQFNIKNYSLQVMQGETKSVGAYHCLAKISAGPAVVLADAAPDASLETKQPMTPAAASVEQVAQKPMPNVASNKPWSGFFAGITGCGVDDAEIGSASKFLTNQGFVMPDPVVRTNIRHNRMAKSSMILYYDDTLLDRISDLSKELSMVLGTTIDFVKGKSSYDKGQIIVHLIGGGCTVPSNPYDYWKEQFYFPMKKGLSALAVGRFKVKDEAEAYKELLAMQDDSKYLTVMRMGPEDRAVYVVTYGVGLTDDQVRRLNKILLDQSITAEQWTSH
ncbi:caspase family protein [Pseudomonas entomophila]|uniref:caspase family protein n=1 Tax=Pseudomonas entomophila TaxID=312306 RepID=UPI001F02CA61|nr:caspase family protein [Pseudomonas entomophila]MCG8295275.1 hypothetical protein [Pseudomonas entomophila]